MYDANIHAMWRLAGQLQQSLEGPSEFLTVTALSNAVAATKYVSIFQVHSKLPHWNIWHFHHLTFHASTYQTVLSLASRIPWHIEVVLPRWPVGIVPLTPSCGGSGQSGTILMTKDLRLKWYTWYVENLWNLHSVLALALTSICLNAGTHFLSYS